MTSVVQLIYVDESYCKVCYYIVAFLVPDNEVQALTIALDTVVNQATNSYDAISPTAELHGYDLFQGKGDWEPIKSMPRARIGVYDQALRAIAKHDVTVIIRGVLTQRLCDRYGDRAWHPHAIALAHLLERCDEYLEGVNDLGLIADEPGQADQRPKYRADLRRYQEVGTSGYRRRRITRIVDTLHFAPSSASRLVQAVDLIAFLYHRIMTTSEAADARAVRANAALWQRIEFRVAHCYCWRP
ncbi:MAG: DUF3800 domain-containing protein [Pseudonocardiaceae bacterium]